MADQGGIKWWKSCACCLWAANVNNNDNANTFCPNCNNPTLDMNIDEHVFNGRRYDLPVQSTRDQEIADEVRQNQGRPPAPPDTVNTRNNGHNYGSATKPFPEQAQGEMP